MSTTTKTFISVQVQIDVPIERVWKCWTTPEDIVNWNFASDDWHSPKAENDLWPGGKFIYRMEAKDGSFGFDFGGTYDEVILHKLIDCTLGDGRKLNIRFSSFENKTELIENFEAETTNPIELQKTGWQSILNNFKKYVEMNYNK